MNELCTNTTIAPPAPRFDVSVRLATESDIPFVDRLQKMHSKAVGFLQQQALEGKVRLKEALIAEDANRISVGYLIGNDRYYKRDDVGIIYQMNILPEFQRSYVASALLKAQFERSAYGCKLYCCYCLKNLDHANRFWENMGFVPLAFRAGSTKKEHIHIFWQKRIRENDQTTPFWYPSKTDNGMLREDRVMLPIPPGTHWSDVHAPEFLAAGATQAGANLLPQSTEKKPRERKKTTAPTVGKSNIIQGGFRFAGANPVAAAEKPKKEPKPKVTLDPKVKEAAREMRDRWLEKVNDGTFVLESSGKYNVARQIAHTPSNPLLAA